MGDDSAVSLTFYATAVESLAEEFEVATIAAAALRLYAEETGRGQIEEQADDVAVIAIPSGGPRGGRFDHDARGGDRQDRFDRPARGDRGERRMNETAEGQVRLFMNVGHNLGIRPQDIVGAIANEANVPGRSIGSIDIFDGYSFVEVPAEDAQRVIEAISDSGIKGKYVNVEISRPDSGPRGGGPGGNRGGDRNRGGYQRDGGGFRDNRGSGGRPGGGGYRRDFEDRAPRFDRSTDDRASRFDRDDNRGNRVDREDNRGNNRFERDDNRGNRVDRDDNRGNNRFERNDRGSSGQRQRSGPNRPDRDRY
jgi:ATP-dependent RNA helicase DeaD